MNLEEKREQWEGDSKVMTVVDHTKDIRKGHLLVVIEDKYKEDRYRCLRYFAIAGNWEVSCDGDSVRLDTVWKWLEDPTARTCNEEQYA